MPRAGLTVREPRDRLRSRPAANAYRSPPRPLAGRERAAARLAAGQARDLQPGADAVRAELAHQRAHAADGLVVHGGDHVALAQARRCRRTVLVDAHHHGANAVIELYRLQPDAEIATCDPAV